MGYPGEGGTQDIRNRLAVVEDFVGNGGVTDGDKGDIVISAGVWRIDPAMASASGDGIEIVGNEIRLDINSLTLAS